MHHAICVLRQHAEHAQLGQAAVDRATLAVAAAVQQQPLVIGVRDDGVYVLADLVRRHDPGEVPFGALFDAGIGELELDAAVTTTSLRSMLHLLAAAGTDDPGGARLVASLRVANLLGVHLRAAVRHGSSKAATASPNWWPLAPPDPRFAGLQRRIERDRDANLPSLVSRRVFAALDAGEDGRRWVPHLDALLAAMLRRGDAGSAGWLLETADHHPGVSADAALLLRQRAQTAWFGTWLDEQLSSATPARLQALTALGMQLGAEALQHLFTRAAALDLELPPGLVDFLT